MGASITLAGESLIAQKLGSQQRLDVVRFIFANVPGLDPNAPVNRAAAKPPAAQIVHSYTIPQQNVGYVNPNQVVYSSMLGSDVGDFDWNWIGLETAENVLLAIERVSDREGEPLYLVLFAASRTVNAWYRVDLHGQTCGVTPTANSSSRPARGEMASERPRPTRKGSSPVTARRVAGRLRLKMAIPRKP